MNEKVTEMMCAKKVLVVNVHGLRKERVDYPSGVEKASHALKIKEAIDSKNVELSDDLQKEFLLAKGLSQESIEELETDYLADIYLELMGLRDKKKE